VLSPIDGRQLTTLSAAGPADVARACASARAAFDDGRWSRLAPAARKAVLHRLADLIEKHALELAVLGVRDNGTEISMALKAEPGSAAPRPSATTPRPSTRSMARSPPPRRTCWP
jgi:gamma-glutamyl-gamma-aminobutyraldehyde dehydrogenase